MNACRGRRGGWFSASVCYNRHGAQKVDYYSYYYYHYYYYYYYYYYYHYYHYLGRW